MSKEDIGQTYTPNKNQHNKDENKVSIDKKKKRNVSVFLVLFIIISFCVFSTLILSRITKSEDDNNIKSKVLSAEEVLNVAAVNAVELDGYVVTSEVCEVVSPINYQPEAIFYGQLVFHSFRIAGPGIESEIIALFASNLRATDKSGLPFVFPVNDEAISLNQGFPSGSSLAEPITEETPGAKVAISCAKDAGKPRKLNFKGFDVEDWRSKAISKFGPEQILDDGSKDDYVRYALSICDLSNSELDTMRSNLGSNFEGSFQQFVLDTFCPNVNDK